MLNTYQKKENMLADANKARIEQLAYDVLVKIWRSQDELWPDRHLLPIEMLDISAMCSVLNIRYETFDNTGVRFKHKGREFRTDGLINRQAGKIAVANSLSIQMARFTAAHEIGHWVLHENEVMHHDRAVDGSDNFNAERKLFEREADYFAGCLLIPKNLLIGFFEEMFNCKTPVRFTADFANMLNPRNPGELIYANSQSWDRELAFAKYRFKLEGIPSLAEIFKVSNQAMAVRIKNLGLIGWP